MQKIVLVFQESENINRSSCFSQKHFRAAEHEGCGGSLNTAFQLDVKHRIRMDSESSEKINPDATHKIVQKTCQSSNANSVMA